VTDLISSILKVFHDQHLFEEGVELIGSWCFYLYQKHLGVEPFPLKTQDVDFLIPNPFRGKEHKGFISQLEALGFKKDFRSDGSLYLWNAELKIEFVTPEKSRGEQGALRIKKLGLSAIPLRFVSFLLDDTIVLMEQGISVLVPHPANFCLHKLLIADRRRNQDKREKDLHQAICASTAAKPNELVAKFQEMPLPWQKSVVRILDKTEDQLPLMKKQIKRLVRTLQDSLILKK